MPHGLNFTDTPPPPPPASGSNSCPSILPEMERERVLPNAGGVLMLIKAIVQRLERDPLKGALLPHAGLHPRCSAGRAVCLGSCVLPASSRRQTSTEPGWWRRHPPTPRFCAHCLGKDGLISADSRCTLATSAFARTQEGLCGNDSSL